MEGEEGAESPDQTPEQSDEPPRQARRESAYVLSAGAVARRASVRPGDSERPDHLRDLLKTKRASIHYMDGILDHQDSRYRATSSGLSTVSLDDEQKKLAEADMGLLKKLERVIRETKKYFPASTLRVEVRLADLNYRVPVSPDDVKIKTVYNQSGTYKFLKWCKRIAKGEKREGPGSRLVLEGINLVLKPGKMYLLLGPPASGKTTLLKAIAGRLPTDRGETVEGSVKYNGLGLKEDKRSNIDNTIAFIEQLDRHAPRLTVQETFQFAFQCVSHGTHASGRKVKSPEAQEFIDKLDKEKFRVKYTMEALGLSYVADTFVGDSDVRGVSGGQRRRVTVGEMMQGSTPLVCGDEISTGLDAASTYDMLRTIMHFTRFQKWTRIFSLLQPGPDTVSLFDEVILLSEGQLIYAGPIHAVEDYFASLGYFAPEHIDVADFLQMLSTPDAAQVFDPPPNSDRKTPYTASELAEAFQESEFGEDIKENLKDPWEYGFENERKGIAEDEEADIVKVDVSPLEGRYSNSFGRSIWLNVKRNLTLYRRDTRFLIANAIKNLVMGASVGGVFYQTEDVVSILGVIFQGMLFIMLGAMTSAPGQVDSRVIFYKQADANFYGAFAYAIGQSIAMIPQALLDVFMFATILYWMVGLAGTAANFFIFIFVLFVFTLVMNQQLFVFASVAATKSSVQAMSACCFLFLVLFGGFLVAPDVIPNYYIWIYWWNPHAWAYRALVVNEFQSPEYDDIVAGTDETQGDLILEAQGFTLNGEPFGQEWIGYSFAYMVPYTILCCFLTALGLKLVRVGENQGVGSETEVEAEDDDDEAETMTLPFTPVTLSFEDICYDVKASKGKDTLRLLNNVNGILASGRMCALMGSSGAGKTTLMDVIVLRKSTGTVAGDVHLNGFSQDPKSFRRCSGYVEQFDVQSPELTVRETVLFSARLRLDSSIPAVATDEGKQAFVDQVLRTLELTSLADCVVGSDEEGGLSFEQKKRLSIAVELAASPSIIFLDEPTSGLDSRAALIVVKCLRRITNTGCTVCATIHQPSSAVFDLFDDLLLLKKGGRAVFFGELGEGSQNLVNYFEARGAKPIEQGENPANWMLHVIGGGMDDENPIDYADEYQSSEEAKDLIQKIEQLKESPDPEGKVVFHDEFAAPAKTRLRILSQRLRTIYWRSPAYNYGRMTISLVAGFILASVFIPIRRPDEYSEIQVSSLLSVIFISFIITGVLAITSVLPVMLQIRDVFYRHQAAGMLTYPSLAYALASAEKWFIVLSSFAFCVTFIPTSGVAMQTFGNAVMFWGFFTFNIAIYSYFGQCFMCCVKGMATAQILASIFIGINNFFSGLIVRPQFLSGIFQFTSWITPGKYVYEGLVIASFEGDTTTVVANRGSDFYESLDCESNSTVPCVGSDCVGEQCVGNVEEYVDVFFGGEFGGPNKVWRNCLILGAFLIVARLSTFAALKKFKYAST